MDIPQTRIPTAAADENPAATPRPLACPEAPTLVGYTRRLLHLTREDRVALFSYSSGGPANWLFLINLADGSVDRYDVPGHERASHGAAVGSDGNIYTITHHQCRMHRFDAAQRTWTTLRHRLPESEMVWDALGAPDGCIYFGTYPNTCFGCYDIAGDELTLWRQIAPHARYLLDFHVLPDGRIDCRSVGECKSRHVFDPRTRTFESTPIVDAAPGFGPFITDFAQESMPPPQLSAGDSRMAACLMPDGGRYGIASPSGRLCRIEPDGRATPIMPGSSAADTWLLITPVDKRKICAVSWTGHFAIFDLSGGRQITGHLPNSSSAASSYYYFTCPGARWVVGGHYSQQNAFRVDQDTGWWESSPGLICRLPGEPTASVSLNGRAYLGVYTGALMLEYDPDQAFEYGVNPRELLQVGHLSSRPRGMATDGRRIYMASWADYCLIKGTLTVYDPQTGGHRVFTNVVENQNLDALAFDAGTGRLIGGTFRWGDGNSLPPRRDAATVYAWDTIAQRTVGEVAPWPDADLVQVLAVLPGGVAVARNGGEIALLDARTLAVLDRGPFPGGELIALWVCRSGRVYGLAAGRLFRWEIDGNRIHPLAQAPDMLYLSVPVPGRFILASPTAIYRLDLPAERLGGAPRGMP